MRQRSETTQLLGPPRDRLPGLLASIAVLATMLGATAQPAAAGIIFQDDFLDGIVAPEFQSIGAATLSESGGKLHVSIPVPGDGFSLRLPAPLDSHCGFFDGWVIPPTAAGDWLRIDLIADAGAGLYVDSSVTLTRTHSITIAVRDKNGTMQVFTIDDQNPEDIVKQWVDKLSGNRRQYEVKFKDGSTWRSPPYDPPAARIAGYDITTSLPSLEMDQVVADDAHRPRSELPIDAEMAIDVLMLGGPTLERAEILLGSANFDTAAVDVGSIALESLDAVGNVLGRAPRAALTQSRLTDGIWYLTFEDAALEVRSDGYLALSGFFEQPVQTTEIFRDASEFGDGSGEEGSPSKPVPWRAAAPAMADADALGTLVARGVVGDDSLRLGITATGPHRADGLDVATVTVTAIDDDSGPLEADELLVTALVGIDDETPLELSTLRPGVFEATYSTVVAGAARFRVEVLDSGLYADAASDFQPGIPVSMNAQVADPVFPDGVSTADVTVQPLDAEGNVAGPGFSEVVVATSLEYELSISACGEYIYAFRSQKPGTFPVTFTELSTGLSETVELLFPVIGPRSPADNPFLVAPGDTAMFSIPIEFHLAPGWDFNHAQVAVRLDPDMVAIGTLSQVRDGDPTDCVEVASWAATPGEGGELEVTVQLLQNPPPPIPVPVKPSAEPLPELCQPTTSSSFVLDLETNGGGEPDVPIEGNVTVTGFDSDAPHPFYGTTSVPIDADTTWGEECLCIKKDYWKGCIIYVRVILPDGQSQPTDMEICEQHDTTNEVFAQGCIFFEKNVTNIVLSDPEFLDEIDTDPEYDAVEQAALDALAAAGIDRGDCLIIIHVGDLGPKGISLAGDPAANPHAGITIVEDSYFGAGNRTAPHEVGHQLEGDPTTDDHAGTSADNLMRPTDRGATGTNLTQDQIDEFRDSDWLEMGTFEFYFCLPFFFF